MWSQLSECPPSLPLTGGNWRALHRAGSIWVTKMMDEERVMCQRDV